MRVQLPMGHGPKASSNRNYSVTDPMVNIQSQSCKADIITHSYFNTWQSPMVKHIPIKIGFYI